MSILRLVYPGFMVVLGLAMLLSPGRFRAARQREYQDRLAARIERGTDAHFEELRELKAYPPSRTDGVWQVSGIVLALLGAFVLFGRMGG
jgi:hypothetical protein